MMPKVEARVSARVRGVSPRWAEKIVAKTLSADRAAGSKVGIYITGNSEIRRINKQFLKHDYATDVIAFNLGEEYLGDIVVSAEMARQKAKELGIAFREELARYLVHGTLHLLGYRDKAAKDKAKMHKRQESLLKKMGLTGRK